MEQPPTDRRIGRRVPIPASRVLWRVPAPGQKRKLFGRRDPDPAELVDVSVSGLRLVAPIAKDLAVGAVVLVTVDGHTGPVRIRVIALGDDGRCTYGVELADPDSALTAHVHRKLSEASDTREDSWHSISSW